MYVKLSDKICTQRGPCPIPPVFLEWASEYIISLFIYCHVCLLCVKWTCGSFFPSMLWAFWFSILGLNNGGPARCRPMLESDGLTRPTLPPQFYLLNLPALIVAPAGDRENWTSPRTRPGLGLRAAAGLRACRWPLSTFSREPQQALFDWGGAGAGFDHGWFFRDSEHR